MAMKKFVIIIVLAIVFFNVVLLSYIKHHHQHSALPHSNAIDVQVATVKSQSMPQQITEIGNLIAKDKVNISPEIAGQISAILFTSGETVAKNTPLIKLDDTVNQAQYNSALADLKLSELNYQRNKELAKTGMVSKQAVDQAKADLDDKQSNVSVKQTELDKMLLTAPYAGRLGAITISVGDYVAVGQNLVTLVNDDHLTVSYQVPENNLAKLKVGQAVTISSNAYPQQKFNGQVSYISPTVDEATRSLTVEADVPNPQHQLSAGLYVKVTQILGGEQQMLVLPEQTLVPTITGQMVYVVQQGKAVATNVTVGNRYQHVVEILSGLKIGDQVVSAGQQKLKDGADIKVVAGS